jgi:hypothetical protein
MRFGVTYGAALALATVTIGGCGDGGNGNGNPNDNRGGDDGGVTMAPRPDAGTPETPTDLGSAPTGGEDAGTPPDMMRVYPAIDTKYGAAEGLVPPIADVSADEAGNLWAAGREALFLLTPNATRWVSFGPAEGIHVEPFTDVAGNQTKTWVTAVAGARPNEVYVGYYGYEGGDPFYDPIELKRLGNADRVTYDPASGTITVKRYEFHCQSAASKCWENRSVRRALFVHTGAAAGHVFFGFNHGVSHVYNDIIGDHIHPEIAWRMPDGTLQTRYGEQRGLAITPAGELWTASRYGVGLFRWEPDPVKWVTTKYRMVFSIYTDDHGVILPNGFRDENRAAAVGPDGRAWFASATRGLTSFGPRESLSTLTQWAGGDSGIPLELNDVVADPDGTIWIVTMDGRLLRLDPTTKTVRQHPGVSGAVRIQLDPLTTPRSLYVATNDGVVVIRTP